LIASIRQYARWPKNPGALAIPVARPKTPEVPNHLIGNKLRLTIVIEIVLKISEGERLCSN